MNEEQKPPNKLSQIGETMYLHCGHGIFVNVGIPRWAARKRKENPDAPQNEYTCVKTESIRALHPAVNPIHWLLTKREQLYRSYSQYMTKKSASCTNPQFFDRLMRDAKVYQNIQDVLVDCCSFHLGTHIQRNWKLTDLAKICAAVRDQENIRTLFPPTVSFWTGRWRLLSRGLSGSYHRLTLADLCTIWETFLNSSVLVDEAERNAIEQEVQPDRVSDYDFLRAIGKSFFERKDAPREEDADDAKPEPVEAAVEPDGVDATQVDPDMVPEKQPIYPKPIVYEQEKGLTDMILNQTGRQRARYNAVGHCVSQYQLVFKDVPVDLLAAATVLVQHMVRKTNDGIDVELKQEPNSNRLFVNFSLLICDGVPATEALFLKDDVQAALFMEKQRKFAKIVDYVYDQIMAFVRKCYGETETQTLELSE